MDSFISLTIIKYLLDITTKLRTNLFISSNRDMLLLKVNVISSSFLVFNKFGEQTKFEGKDDE